MAVLSVKDQPWYWGNVDKSFVAELMAGQRNGSFMVRDASIHGEYTLTLRYKNQTKLVRIHVQNGRCGFSTDALTYDSVPSLIEFHRNCSLKAYNEQLDTCLLYPVCRKVSKGTRQCAGSDSKASLCLPSNSSIYKSDSLLDTQSLQSKSPEWELRLGLERLRISQTAVDRAARLFDAVHSETQRAETLHHALTKSLVDLDRKRVKLEEVLETQIFVVKDSTEPAFSDIIMTNRLVVERSLELLKNEKMLITDQKLRLVDVMEKMREEAVQAKKRLVFDQEVRNQAYRDLHEKHVCRSKMEATTSHSLEMLAKESMQVSMLLADLPLPWDPKQYLVNESSKDSAATLILHARNRAVFNGRSGNGIFLIRPSATQSNKLVLSVLIGERVSHCLIEQNEQGWGFENGGLYFVTIGDFVRYYAHASLEEHNKDIKTALTMPAL